MIHRFRSVAACSLFLLASIAAQARAQEAVTLTGHVSSVRTPLRGASVRIEELGLEATTDAQGRYSLIVSSARVRGQAVTITARYLRYRPQSASVRLVGGALVQDFELRSATDAPAEPSRPVAEADTVRRSSTAGPPAVGQPSPVREDVSRLRTRDDARLRTVGPAAFVDLAGAADVPSALAGRLAGVEVRSSAALGGTTAITVRGPHTVAGLTQPLVVVNGIPIDDANITTAGQRAGQGGFDFGSALSDLNPEDVASVELLRGPTAAMRYGGRAASGVLLVTTRTGSGLSGFDISASQQFASETPLRLPEYQNLYGQGLGGAFSFFNGQGGGVNDSVSQSWGPALLAQPIAQASLTEAGRAEVRTWIPRPDNVSEFFERGRTLATNVAAQGSNDAGQFRLSVSNRDHSGLVPQSGLARRALTFTGGYRPGAKLKVAGDVQYHGIRGEDRPGTGVSESNPVSVFATMGRQVDVQALRERQRDATGRQISWHYSGHNNPYFAALENSNEDERTRWIGGVSASYLLSDWLRGTARVSTDRYDESRRLRIASGWMGGFPYFAGTGDFSTGGQQDDQITASQTSGELWLRATPATSSASALAFSVGAGRVGTDLHTVAQGSDRLSNPTPLPPQDWRADGATTFLAGMAEATLLEHGTLALALRHESSSLLSASASQLYPSLVANIDLVGANPSLRDWGLDALRVRAGWSRSGRQGTPALLQQLGFASGLVAGTVESLVAPELTSGWEAGAEAQAFAGRMSAGATLYNERSENLVVPAAGAFSRIGAVTNKGIELQLELVPVRARSFEWRVGANVARNDNLVTAIGGGATATPLGVSVAGMSVEAREGEPLGALVGVGYLRDAAGQLLLRNGAPLPDSITGARVLGSSAPSWLAGFSSGVHVLGLDLSVLFDVRRGGRIFSASNRAGAYAGVLAETSFRPDTGLLISGIDVATGAANTVHVSTEAYYHALGAVAERWVYDAGFVKLREARASFALPLHAVGLHAQTLRVALIGRNLALWTDAPNIDPEFVLSTGSLRGIELGQLPTARAVGIQLSLTP
jgi:hypothetical protein